MSSERVGRRELVRQASLGQYLQMDPRWAFALCARLWAKDPDTDALRILTTFQALEDVPEVVLVCAGLVAALFPGGPLWAIPTALIAGAMVGLVAVRAGMVTLLRYGGLLRAGRLWSFVPPLPFHLLVVLLLLVTRGWAASLMWLMGYVGFMIGISVVEYWLTVFRVRRVGLRISASGASF